MNPGTNPGQPSPPPDPVVAATQELRRHADQRWVEIADHVLSGALRATRRTHLVRAGGGSSSVLVSTEVLTTHLRAAIEAAVHGVAVDGVEIELVGRADLGGVRIHLVVQFGQVLLDVGDHVRAVATRTLHELLGAEVGPVPVTLDVHVEDVTVGDPQRIDPTADVS